MREYLVGIDEVGRGSLAGPITVVALAYPRNLKLRATNLKLKDSKQLTAKQRAEWLDYVKNHPEIFYAMSSVTPNVIDRINVTRAANLAATRALSNLITNYKLPITRLKVFLDGGLYINESRIKNQELWKSRMRTVVRGDERYKCVRLASIVAKVTRDRYMAKKSLVFPEYRLKNNKGYGTKNHMIAVKKHGPTNFHRLTFLRNISSMKANIR